MKNILYKITFVSMAGLLGLSSCTKDFEEINTDPNAFSAVRPENQMAGAMKSTLDQVGGWMNDHMFMNYAHYYGGMGGPFERYYYSEPGVIGLWQDLYTEILKNLEVIIDTYGEDPEYSNRIHMTKIWKSHVYSVMVSTFGGVPMSQANGEATEVPYDTEEQIYTNILGMLKEAGENITTGGDNTSHLAWISVAGRNPCQGGNEQREHAAFFQCRKRIPELGDGRGELVIQLRGLRSQW